MREIVEGDEVFVVKARQIARVRLKKVTPHGEMLYGVIFTKSTDDMRRDNYRRNYTSYCDTYCVRKDMEPLLI